MIDAVITSERTEPTAEENGQIVYTATVGFNGTVYTDTQIEVLLATGHSYGEPVWTWAEDYSWAFAVFTCVDGDDTQELQARVDSERTAPSCTEDGQIVYTASVYFNGKTWTDEKTVTIPAMGHSYERPAWTWAEDYSSATATFTCIDGDDTQVVQAEIFSERTEPTTEEDGKIVYTATVEFLDMTWADIQTVILPKLPVGPIEAPVLSLAGMSTQGIALQWTPVEGASGYAVMVSVNGEGGPVRSAEGTTFLDEYASMGLTYTYTVMARVGDGWSETSNELEVFYNPFADVSGKKTIEYVAWAFNNGIVNGTSTTTFTPDDPCTRVQFVMMLWKMHGSPIVEGTNPFSDISGKKTTNAILWALDDGVIVKADKFNPNDNISRVQIVMILWKLAGSPEVMGDNPFKDVFGKKTSKAVLWAYQNGITKGTSSTTFAPEADCTRVQLVVFLYKYNGIYNVI